MKIEQTDSTSSATHLCISFRISNCYLFLILLQLALGLTLFVTLFNKLIIHAAVIQILIGFFISLDLLIKYFSSEKNFFEEKENYVDIIVLGILIFCIGASQVNFSKFLYYNGDSIMSAVCVVTRYCIQLFRLICLFKTSKQMIQIHKISDDINLELIGEQLCETDANSNAQ